MSHVCFVQISWFFGYFRRLAVRIEEHARLFYIYCDLSDQILYRRKPHLTAESMHETDFEGSSIDIARKRQQMRLYSKLLSVKGGAHAKIGHAGMRFAIERGKAGIHAERGKYLFGPQLHVSGWKPDGPAALVAVNDFAFHSI